MSHVIACACGAEVMLAPDVSAQTCNCGRVYRGLDIRGVRLIARKNPDQAAIDAVNAKATTNVQARGNEAAAWLAQAHADCLISASDRDRMLAAAGVTEMLAPDHDNVPGEVYRVAKKRIAELETAAEQEKWLRVQIDQAAFDRWGSALERANHLSDEAGALRTERDDLLRENAVLRRKLEAVERKAAKR